MDELILTANHRCDGCAAQARVRLMLMTGEIQLCKSHFDRSEARLRELAIEIDDQRQALYA